jgi:hypothetical protein
MRTDMKKHQKNTESVSHHEVYEGDRGCGMSYMAEKIAEELGTEFKLKDCVVLDDVAFEDVIKSKKYIYQTPHTTRAREHIKKFGEEE